MKKTIMVTMIICVLSVFVASFAIAESLPPYAKSILESWGASSAEELRVNMINYWASLPHASSDTHPDFPGYQVKITFGQTTEELINAPESWNLAIVSSREVNLQKVADAGLLPEQPHYPNSGTVVDYRFLPEKLHTTSTCSRTNL